jgi:hypothetical protein
MSYASGPVSKETGFLTSSTLFSGGAGEQILAYKLIGT